MEPITLKKTVYQYRYYLLFAAIFSVYFINLFIDVMDIDAAQYAVISMDMSRTKSFLQVYLQGHDYLDKPPLLFWLSSVSFILFGISNLTYKLPSILIGILGIYSTYRFAKLWYSREKAILSSLILAGSQAMFLITNDVRTDTILMGLVMFSIWQLSAYLKNNKWGNLILASLGIGGAMMAKGPIAIVIPVVAFGSDLLIKRQWNNIFKPQWIVLLIIVTITLIPMCYGLYTQFDLHPEKMVYGLKGPSGLRFFFWTQSFGRITGENYWNNNTGFFYFFHTIIWDFQPWILLFIPALILKIRNFFVKGFKIKDKEFISLCGFVLIFIAFSLSKYKLPHYIFVLFPFASVLTADFIYNLKDKWQFRVAKIQFSIMHLFWLAMVVNFFFFFPPKNFILPLALTILFIIDWVVYKGFNKTAEQIFIPTIITAVAFNLLMGLNFYPDLLKYQGPSQAGKMAAENKIPADQFFYYKSSNYSLSFYARRDVPAISLDKMAGLKKGSWIFTSQQGINEIRKKGIKFNLIRVFPSFEVTRLKLSFLYRKTREHQLEKECLIKIGT